jgi:hypothetical protein
MVVVAHQNVGMELPAELACRLRQDLKKRFRRSNTLEQIFPVVAPIYDMVPRSCVLDPKLTSHEALLRCDPPRAQSRKTANNGFSDPVASPPDESGYPLLIPSVFPLTPMHRSAVPCYCFSVLRSRVGRQKFLIEEQAPYLK